RRAARPARGRNRSGNGRSLAARLRALRPADRQHPRRAAGRAGARLRRGRAATRPPAARRLAGDAGARRARGLSPERLPSRRPAGERRLVDPVAAPPVRRLGPRIWRPARWIAGAIGAVIAMFLLTA